MRLILKHRAQTLRSEIRNPDTLNRYGTRVLQTPYKIIQGLLTIVTERFDASRGVAQGSRRPTYSLGNSLALQPVHCVFGLAPVQASTRETRRSENTVPFSKIPNIHSQTCKKTDTKTHIAKEPLQRECIPNWVEN